MESVTLLDQLSPAARVLLERDARILHIRGGEVLFRAGEEGDGVYFVVSGRLRALQEGEPMRAVGDITRGESVGEMALILNEHRRYTVIATRDSTLAFLPKDDCERLFLAHPELLQELTRLVVKRYQRRLYGEERQNRVSAITLLAEDAIAAAGMAEQLRKTASAMGISLLCVTAEMAPHAAEGALSRWLGEQEKKQDLVIFLADPHDTEWSAPCLRQSDRVWLLASAGQAPPSWLGPWLRDYAALSLAQWDLLQLQQEACAQPGTSQPWLALHPFSRVHHLRPQAQEDHARLLRWATGNAIGLVLSGGGARGFAHIGVIRALEEAGIPIDAVGGVSMGSVIAALLAYGHDSASIEHSAAQTFTRTHPLRDLTLPLVAFVRGGRLNVALHHAFGESDITDLWLPYFCLSCNLTRAEPVIHQRGALWEAVRASVAIPGIFPPLVKDRQLYVDGALVDNLPIEAMHAMGVGHILAIDVAGNLTLRADYPDTAQLSSLELLTHRRRKRGSFPGIFSILLRSGTIGSVNSLKQAMRLATHYLNVPLPDHGMLDWKQLSQIAEAGYRCAKEQVGEWLPTASADAPPVSRQRRGGSPAA